MEAVGDAGRILRRILLEKLVHVEVNTLTWI
jgi:hypothetical protein